MNDFRKLWPTVTVDQYGNRVDVKHGSRIQRFLDWWRGR